VIFPTAPGIPALPDNQGRTPHLPGVKYNENLLFATKGPSWPGTIAFIPGAYAANSLLGGSTEFRRRTTNSSRPINRKTIEFERAVKTANAALPPFRLLEFAAGVKVPLRML
jgi:hypothetical protein